MRGKELAEKIRKIKEGQLYKCSVCGSTAYVDKKTKQMLINFGPMELPKKLGALTGPISVCLPSHDCELGKTVNKIDLKKLVKVKKKPKKDKEKK